MIRTARYLPGVLALFALLGATGTWAQIGYMKLDPPPVAEQGSTLLPFRQVAEAFGAKVSFDPKTSMITAQRAERTIKLTLNQTQAQVNGKPTQLPVAPKTIQGTTYLPLRAVAEALGIHVEFRPGTIKLCTSDKCVLVKPPGG